MKTRLFSLWLLLSVAVGLSAYNFKVDGLCYDITSSTTVKVTCEQFPNNKPAYKDLTTAYIPQSVTYNGRVYSVTSIAGYAFRDCRYLTKVSIPNSITTITGFSGCTSLTSITIPNSATSIEQNAFYGCISLASLTIPNSVTSIGQEAFRWCTGLTSITIPNSVTSIGRSAFSGCTGLTSITIPNSVTSIEQNAFSVCTGLTSITIPNSVTEIGDYAFSGCTGLTSITIPNSVMSIGKGSFSRCTGLTSITIPNSVTSIGQYAFSGCTGITLITIPINVTDIAVAAFYGCTSLTSVVWDAKNCHSVFSKANTPFYYENSSNNSENSYMCPITSFVFGDSVQYIPNCLLSGLKNVISITIPSNVTRIGNNAFEDASITSVVWNAQNYKDENTLFYNDGFDLRQQITSFVFGDNVQYIPAGLCNGMKNLTSITIPNSVTVIGNESSQWEGVFSNCTGLTSVVIGHSVTSIGWYAFSGCTSLTSITIPNSVTSIGIRAFYGCEGLTSITIPNSVTELGDETFADCTGLTSVTIPNSVTSLGGFSGCTGLTSLTIPNSVKSIGYRAFAGCTGLTSVSIGNSVTSIGQSAFEDCTGLTSITIPNSVTSIGSGAFEDCTSLTSISIGKSVTKIGDGAFSGCGSLATVVWNAKNYVGWLPSRLFYGVDHFVFGDSVQHIPDYLCLDMKKLTSITIPNSVTSIGQSAFEDCTGLTSVTIAGRPFIDSDAFSNCKSLKSITINALWSPLMATYDPDDRGFPFSGVEKYIDIYIPCGSYRYSYRDWWKSSEKYSPQYIETPLHYEITAQPQDSTKGIVKIVQTNTCNNDTTIIVAEANEHYRFDKWSDGNMENPRKVVVVGDTTYIAEFVLLTNHTIFVTCNSLQGLVTGSGTYQYGTIATLTATPNKGYMFIQWSDGDKDNPRKVTVTADATYTAEFTSQTYTITATCDKQHGQVTGGGTYPYGSKATLTATPNDGYVFTQWSDGNKDNPRKVTVTADAIYTAEFALQNYVVSATCAPQHGQVTGGGTYPYGSKATLTATPNNGYEFKQWSDGSTANPYSFLVEKDMTIEALFEPTTPIENVVAEEHIAPRKVFRNGQVYILRGGKTYTLTGVEINL